MMVRLQKSYSTGLATTAADWEALEKGIVNVYGEVHGAK